MSLDICCLSISLLPLDISTASRSSSGAISPLSSDARPKVSREAFLSGSASFQKFPERLSFPGLHPPESFPTLPPEISRFLLPLDSLRPRGLRQASYLHFHQSPARKFPERPSSPIQRHLESFPTLPPEISRFLLPLDSLRPRGLRQAPYLHFHQSPSRKSPERLSSPSQRPPESLLTTPPEISRFPLGTKVIKILDLSPYLPPTRPFTVSPTLSYSPKPVLPISKASLSYSPKPVLHKPRHQTESAPLVHQSPSTFYPHLTLSYNNTHQSRSSPTTPPDRIHFSRSSIAFHVLSSFHPVLQQHSSVQFITSDNYQVRFPDRPIRIVILQTGNSLLATHGIAGNCTEFEAVSTYVTLKK